MRVGDFIPTVLGSAGLYLGAQLAALDELAKASTAALERALAEHLDCLSYRFDAWRLGLTGVQLALMRQETD